MLCSDLTSAWSSVFPFLNDSLLLQSLERKKRPDAMTLKNLYDSPECVGMIDLLQRAWVEEQVERPGIREVR